MSDGAADPRSDDRGRDPVEVLAETFLERIRSGEKPTVEEFAEAHPKLAGRIRNLFPMLLQIEDLGATEVETRASSSDAPMPRRLGEYRILRTIGRGGMGIVYEAEQESLGRRVALKVLPAADSSDENRLERFRQEARAAARLHHTNIVPVFGVGAADGLHFYAMQFIHGQSLAEVLDELRRRKCLGTDPRIRRATPPGDEPGTAVDAIAGDGTEPLALGPDDAREADSRAPYARSIARIGLQAAEALAYAHGEGILHRDIKPANLLLDSRGVVWVTDFGLAKGSGVDDLTASGNIVGTLRYMAPERLRGVEDARSDVYSLGATLYELLTLRPAFAAADRGVLLRDLASRVPPPVRALDPTIPRDLETVVIKAMEKSPRDRYATAAALADDLRRFLDFEPVSARRLTAVERSWRWCQRNPMVATLSAAIAALSIALAAGGAISATKLREERDTAFARLMDAKLEEGRAWRRSGILGQRSRSLAAFREAAKGRSALDVRNEVIASLALCDVAVADEWQIPDGWQTFDERHERSARRGPGNSVLIFDADHRAAPIATLRGGDSPVSDLVFSPSSRLAAVRRAGEEPSLAVWDIAREEVLFEVPRPPTGIPIDFRPDDTALAAADAQGRIILYSLPGGQPVRTLGAGPAVRILAFAPGGDRLAVVGVDADSHVVRILDTESGAVLARLHHPELVRNVAWHPAGGLLATACFDFNVHVWEAANGRKLQLLEGHFAEVVDVAFSPDGELFASAGWDYRTRIWDGWSGRFLVSAHGRFTAFSRDGRKLGFQAGSSARGVWRIIGGSEYRVLRVPQRARRFKDPRTISVSPDGRWLAAACGLEGVRVWNLDAPAAFADLAVGFAWDAAFEPGSAALLTVGSGGVVRWPLRESDAAGVWSLGPPEPLGVRGSRLSIDPLRQMLAMIRGHEIVVHAMEDGSPEIARFEHVNVDRLELSSSCRWLVTTTWGGADTRVWNVAAAVLETSFPGKSMHARFSPDERWIAVSTGSHITVHDTEIWGGRLRVERQGTGDIPSPLAFSADSRLLALVRSGDRVDIYSMESGKEVARFEPPDSGLVNCIEFAPDSSRLAIASVSRSAVQVWDLHGVRRELAGLGLDWENALADRARAVAPARAIRVDDGSGAARARAPQSLPEWVRGQASLELTTQLIALDPSAENFEKRAELHARLGATTEAIADLDHALTLEPENADLVAERARLLESIGDETRWLADLDQLVELRRLRHAADSSPPQRDALAGALKRRARGLARLGKLDAASADWRAVLEIDPSDAGAGRELAWLWSARPAATADGREILALAERARSGAPRGFEETLTAGAVRFRCGDLEGAEAALAQALDLARDRPAPECRLFTALVFARQGRLDDARRSYERAVAEIERRVEREAGLPRVVEALRAEAAAVIGEGAAGR